MTALRAFVVLPFVVALMAVVDMILFKLPIPGWIPVATIACQALNVTVVYGSLLMSAALPRTTDSGDGEAR